MPKAYRISFHDVSAPITTPVTKFGGQPVWIAKPAWPLSRSTGQPMQFICQIALDPELGSIAGRSMAYLFMTDDLDGSAPTWDANTGENALIIQPGHYEGAVAPLTTGPTLFRLTGPRTPDTAVPVEFAVSLEAREDPPLEEIDMADDALWRHLEVNKIGGTPCFIQGEEYPSDDRTWNFLLQLTDDVPFVLNLGDAGIGYAFLSDDGQIGKFLWQCG